MEIMLEIRLCEVKSLLQNIEELLEENELTPKEYLEIYSIYHKAMIIKEQAMSKIVSQEAL